jgi:hypothetical protein
VHIFQGLWLRFTATTYFSKAKRGLSNLDIKSFKFNNKKEHDFANAFEDEVTIDIGSSSAEANSKRLKEQSMENIPLNNNQYGGI